MLMTSRLPFVEGYVREPDSFSRQGMTFKIVDPGFEWVTFQLTKKDKLGVFAPEGLELGPILEVIKPYLEKAAEKPVKLTPLLYETEGEPLPKGAGVVTVTLPPETQRNEAQRPPPPSVEDVLLIDVLKHVRAMAVRFATAKSCLRYGSFSDDYVARMNHASSSIDKMDRLANQIIDQRFREARGEIDQTAVSMPEQYRTEYWRAINLASLSREHSPKVVDVAVKATLDAASKLSRLVDGFASGDKEGGSFWRFLQRELVDIKSRLDALKTG